MTTPPVVAVPEIEAAGVRYALVVKAWETAFFGRVFGTLAWQNGSDAGFPNAETAAALHRLCASADTAGFAVIECHLDVADFAAAPVLESAGFRLVDSRIRFLTRWSAADIPETAPAAGRILDVTPDHRSRIIALTHLGFTDNPGFVSRFKNTDFFTGEETRRYFEAWIDGSAFASDAVTAVYEVDGEVVGYYVYQVRGANDGLAVVKGILTSVAAEHRGSGAQLAMQTHLYRRLGLAEWYVDNTTQLTNLPVIRNHMQSGKRLEQIALTFYRAAATP